MREPNGIAFAGDWHGNTNWAERMIVKSGQHLCDTIVHTGDYGYRFDHWFVEWVEGVLARWDMILLFVDGNHDEHEFLWALPEDKDGFGILTEHVRYIPRGHRWEWWGKKWMGLGGAVSVDRFARTEGKSWWRTEEITDSDIRRFSNDGEADIVIAHDVPAFVNVPGIVEGRYGQWPVEFHSDIDRSWEHRKKLTKLAQRVQPKRWIHGHYHRYYETDDGGLPVVGLDCDGTSFEKNIWSVYTPEELTPAS